MRNSLQINLLFCCITFFFIFFACKKNEYDHIPSSSIRINSIFPESGRYGSYDTIRGNGFGRSADSVKFFFNNISADIISINDTEIIVTVPKKAGGYVSIKKANEQVTGPLFNYIYTIHVTTLAGKGYPGYSDGKVQDALFNYPRGLAMDSQGNMYVADFGNNRIRKISSDGIVSTVAGNGIKDYRDGPASDAEFYALNGIVLDNQETLYITDANRVRKLSLSSRIVSTVAGGSNKGNVDGTGIDAEFSLVYGITKDLYGNLFVTDVNNNSVRKITANGTVTTIAGNGIAGYADGYGSNALFTQPGQLTIDTANGNIYVADAGNFRVRQMNTAGHVYTYAGDGNFGYKDGRFFEAEFKFPTGITTDTTGNVFVCGEENVIREISKLGDVTTIAGSGIAGYADGPAETAMFNQPIYLITDVNDVIYVADHSNHCIRKVVIE